MIIGKLDRRIQIQSLSETRDSFGGNSPAWNTLYSVWASVTPLGGIEKDEADKTTATSPVTFSIRYITGLREKMRIVYNSDIYNIISIGEPDRRRSLTITAQKKI
jgi:SPP1 family predicted phage head-tail adaptor